MKQMWKYFRERFTRKLGVLEQAEKILEDNSVAIAGRKEVLNNCQGLLVYIYDGFGFAHHFRGQIEKCKSSKCKFLVAVFYSDGTLRAYNCNHPQVTWVVEIGGVQKCPKKMSVFNWS